MDADETADNDEVLDRHVPAERGAIGDNVAVADTAVMRDVAVHHEQIFIPYSGHHAAAACSRIERNIFTNRVAIADDELARLAFIFEILWRGPDGRERKNDVALPDGSTPLNRRVRMDLARFANLDPGADYAERTDLHIAVELGVRIDDRAWMYPTHRTSAL